MSADVASRVLDLRTRLGLTQEQLAQRLGVTYSTVNHWENGKRTPQPFLMRRLRDLEQEGDGREHRSAGPLDVSLDRMLERIIERFNPERVILFGSRARGDARRDSDVDLLVVMPVEGSLREAQLGVRMALRDIRAPKDVVVTTPERFQRRRSVVGTIERAADREGRVLYVR